MRNKPAFHAIVCALTLALVSCRPGVSTPPPARPNVLFISIDTLSADYLGAYGGTEATTPTLDALAEDGVLFERAVAHVPLTLPSHASMFTSLIPPSHGVRDNGTFVLEHHHETLAEILRASGYRTGAFVGAFVLDAQFGLAQGFEVYDDDVEGTAENDRPADIVLEATGKWIEEVDNDPWFAFVHLFDPHAPYEAPSPFGENYRNAPYAGEVAYVDDAIGRFLRDLGTLEDTLVVVTADHGEGLGEHGERTHGMFAYDSTLHVPLVLHWPNGLPNARRVPSRVRLIDVAPTIAELVGVEPPASFRGRSLARLIHGHVETDRPSYFETFTYSFNYGSAPLTGLYQDQYKFVSLPIPELYDLADDPDEARNLAEHHAGTVEQMSARLSDLVASELDPADRQPAPVDEAARERLESLGYISSANPLPNLGQYGPADDPKQWVHLADMLDEAVAHHRARRPAEAIELLRAIIAEKDDVAIVHARLARILHEEGRTDEAIAVLEDALELGIRHPNIITALGAFLREAGDEAKWTDVLRDVVARNPDDADAHEALASSFLRRGLSAEAIPHLQRFVELDPTQYDTLVQIGLALADLGRVDEAHQYLSRFAATAPDEIYREDKLHVQAFIDELEVLSTTP